MDALRNWAGNIRYQAERLMAPGGVDELREILAQSGRAKILGSRHTFNRIADTDGVLVSLERLNRILELDPAERTVRVEGGVRYGELAAHLDREGWALRNLASLPHITVAGACATGTHGSGDANGNLATSVRSFRVVTASGEIVSFSREAGGDFYGAAVHLGALGAVFELTLDLEPAFEMSQEVFLNLPFDRLVSEFEAIFSSGYSVSAFLDWRRAAVNQIWVKRRLDQADPSGLLRELGAEPARGPVHPVPGQRTEHCTPQLGEPGPWHERLPHFRMEFTPSSGEELQSEWFIPRRHAAAALRALYEMREEIAPLLQIGEVRTVAADEFWLSPCHGRASVGLHFTWKLDEAGVGALVPRLEAALAPFGARPHWGKVFGASPERLEGLYERLGDFRRLAAAHDPEGKFRNAFLDRYVFRRGDRAAG